MANIVFKLGTLDLSQYVRVNQQEGLDLGQGDMVEPAWSDSPLFEGQTLTSIHAKNKELKVPLYLHPPTAPYTNDALNQIVQQVNQALRPVVDLGYTVYAEWRNAQATNSTFFTIQYGRFEPNFNFRITEKGWLAGVLHLWVLPYAHTATERVAATNFMTNSGVNNGGFPALQTSPQLFFNPVPSGQGTIAAGDISPQFDIRVQVGSYLAPDGRLTIISALPILGYTPYQSPSQFIGKSASAIMFQASGAAASSFIALDARGASPGAAGGASPGAGQFSFALSPGSIYAGDNRVMGWVRARAEPFCLRAFDPQGQPLGPTVVASALDGWQLVDYGTLRIPPWLATVVVGVQAYNGPAYNASGMFAPRRAAPAWTKEIGPMMVLPNNSTIFNLDFNSPAIAIDGFDSATGVAISQDQLGNTWSIDSVNAPFTCLGNSRAIVGSGAVNTAWIGSPIGTYQDYVIEAVFGAMPSTSGYFEVGLAETDGKIGFSARCQVGATPFLSLQWEDFPPGATSWASQALSILSAASAVYHLQLMQRNGAVQANLFGPSGMYAGSASGVAASIGMTASQVIRGQGQSAFVISCGGGTIAIEAFRSRILASSGYQPRDYHHLYQPLVQNTRMTPAAVDIVDLQGRQRGPVQAIALPVPSLGAGVFVAQSHFDQGPINDRLDVDIRVRERFIYAR